jgi:hypothetical protein
MPSHLPRLTPLDRSAELRPWKHAHQFKGCFLYWAPVSRFPILPDERRWQLAFLKLFVDRLEQTHKVIADTFVDARMATENEALRKGFLNTASDFRPLLGFARAPGANLPEASLPQADLDAFARGERKPNPCDYLPNYCYWFVNRSGERQRELFFGHGGMTVLFMKPDPKTAPPPEFAQLLPYLMRSKMLAPLREKFDIEKMVMRPNPLAGDFRDTSKTVFGEGMERDQQFRGLPYIIPRLRTRDYFEAEPRKLEAWFSVFAVYLRESPEDGGVLLASKQNLEEDLLSVLDRLRSQGESYPEWILREYSADSSRDRR